ncbi:MAG: hypothetical protein F4Z97_05460 [Gammaproteobacteria bacterium]|nr:hypothetical protein [Gammaproteobacteria bacterium]MYI89787.1 hypothetical protein [Gammaproteobacteria bacterium]
MFRSSRLYLIISIVCIVIFALNIVIGKIEIAYRINTHVHLEGVPEFLVLLLSVIFFVISALIKERSENNKSL